MQGILSRLALKPQAFPGFFLTQRASSFPGQNGIGRWSIRELLQITRRTPQPRVSWCPSLRVITTNARHPHEPLTTYLRRWLSTSPRSFLRHHVPQPRRKPQFLGFFENIPPNTIFYGIIGLNTVVFVMWFMAIQKYKQERDPSAIYWMEQNFTNSWKNLTSGRIWTPLTACFSHQDWSHILLNGFTFFFMAPPVLQMLGTRQFIFLYMGGGLVSSFASMIYAKLTGKHNYASHGASGAIYSVVSLLACVAPTLTFQLYGIIPVPAWLAVTGFFTYDLYSTLSKKEGTTDTVGHIGGILAGIGYFLLRSLRVF